MSHVLTMQWPGMLALAALLALFAGGMLARAGAGRVAVVVRLAIVLALGAALAQPVLVRESGQGRLVLVDRSDGVAPGAADEALAALEPGAAGVPVLPFGAPPGARDLAQALDQAVRALPGGGKVWLLTADGGERRSSLAAADRAWRQGLTLDVLPLAAPGAPDAAITALDVPPRWRAGEDVPVTVSFRSSVPAAARLSLRSGQQLVASVPVTVSDEVATVRLSVTAPEPGPLAMEARIILDGDAEAGNDMRPGLVWVYPPPRVMVVGDGLGAVLLADALVAEGVDTSVLAPERLPGRLSALRAWDVLALVDVPASALGLEQQAAVAAFAAELGGGVLLSGGRQSFLPGGWARTALADLAPVDLEPPPRDQHDEVALLLMVDQSASMGSTEGGAGLSKLALAREAAALAAEALHGGDRIGVISYDDSARWLVPLDQVVGQGDPTAVETALGSLDTGGGTRIESALELGLPALAAVGVPTRHAVLLTDGRDFSPDQAAYDRLVRTAREAGVTLSTIALGSDADQDLLARLAALGRGRFHVAAEPGDLPRLTVQESETVRARSEQQGRYRVRRHGDGPQPALAGLSVASLPEITGYLATTVRPGAAVALEVPGGDPLLATWQFGAGRVTAWLSDTGEEWASAWRGGVADAFWARLVRHLAPDPATDGLAVAVTQAADGLRVVVDAQDDEGRPLDLADVALTLTATQGTYQVPLPQRAPGRYAADVALAGPVAVPAEVRLSTAGAALATHVGLVMPPVAPPPPARAAGDRLAALAAAGGGRVLAGPEPLDQKVPARRDLWPWLVALAAALWPLDIALGLGLGYRRGGVRRIEPAAGRKESEA